MPPVNILHWEAWTDFRQEDCQSVSLPFHLRHEKLAQAHLLKDGKCLNTELVREKENQIVG